MFIFSRKKLKWLPKKIEMDTNYILYKQRHQKKTSITEICHQSRKTYRGPSVNCPLRGIRGQARGLRAKAFGPRRHLQRANRSTMFRRLCRDCLRTATE